MCGRYQFSSDDESVIEEINKIFTRLNEKYNKPQIHLDEIYPSNNAPVYKNENDTRDISLMSWGFHRADGSLNINSRSERKLYAKAFKNRRCAVPATGFYEFKENIPKKPKDKYLFTYPNAPIIYMAGIYKTEETQNGNLEHFVILTREANAYVNEIHNRMPAMLYENEISLWLNDDKFAEHLASRDSVRLEKHLVKRDSKVEQISLF